MKQRIESLTPAQQARFGEFIEKWTRIGLSTEPANRPAAEVGVRKAYEIAGMPAPERIVWCGSPLSMGLTRAIVFGLYKAEVQENIKQKVGDSVGASVRASVRDSVWDSVRDSVWDSGYGQHDANAHAFYEYFREACGLSEETRRLCGLDEIAKNAGWWLPHEKTCWISERHNVLNRNDRGQLHCDDGPALAYPDGWCIYAIDGIRLDEQIVMRPETQTVKQIESEQNGDIRSIRIDRFGWPRYLKESGAECIEHRDNAIEGTKEALYRTKNDGARFVVTCPTGRLFALGVPRDVRTCGQAQDWLAGGKNFRVLART